MALKKSHPHFSLWQNRDELRGDMDVWVTVLEACPTKAGRLQQGMMQELLTRRIRFVRCAESSQ